MYLVKVVVATENELEEKINDTLMSLGHKIIDIKLTSFEDGKIVAMIYYET